MKDNGFIIIKIYRNDFSSSAFHDLEIEPYEEVQENLKNYVESIGRRLYIVGLYGVDLIDTTPFAEIEYGGSLSENEKQTMIRHLKNFFSDAFEDGEELTPCNCLKTVIFKNVSQTEIYE